MFVKYYGQYWLDGFRATVRSKKAETVKAEAIVVPIVVAIVLFAIIFAVIKCTKITRSAGPAATSGVNAVPLQPLPRSSEIAPTPELVPPPSSQSLFPNTEDPPPSYAGTLSTASAPHPFSTDYSPGVPNTAMGDGTVHF